MIIPCRRFVRLPISQVQAHGLVPLGDRWGMIFATKPPPSPWRRMVAARAWTRRCVGFYAGCRDLLLRHAVGAAERKSHRVPCIC